MTEDYASTKTSVKQLDVAKYEYDICSKCRLPECTPQKSACALKRAVKPEDVRKRRVLYRYTLTKGDERLEFESDAAVSRYFDVSKSAINSAYHKSRMWRGYKMERTAYAR